jgi:hypothetical protein
MNKKYLMYLAIFTAGVIAAPRVKTLPGFNKLPSL